MNHIYHVVYNAETNTYQAVPENNTGKHKTASEKSSCAVSDVSETGSFFSLKPMALCAMAMGLSSTGAWAAPTGGHISAGDASIAQHGKITNIQQNSPKAAINWQSFGIKADETVNFKQPNAQAVILNRVIGNEKSVIDGAMNANGKVFISNPNGMIIGKNAQINVGALVGTTAKIKDQDFMNDFFKFDKATGDITQLGDIKVPTGGVVALIAPIVANKGNITAPQGKVLLASAEQFSITLPDNGQFAYTLDRGTLQGLVDNGGAILADGGHVILTAKGTDAVKKSLIKHTGKIEANTVQNKNGVIELLGDLDNTRLEASGSLKAEAKEKGNGGFIETSAADVKIQETAQISTKAKEDKPGKWKLDPNNLIIGENGTMRGFQVENALKNNGEFELNSTNGTADGKGDVIINDEISWNTGTLTINSIDDIRVNENLNGTDNARLELLYGQATANGVVNGIESDYYIKQGKKINLPTGPRLVTQRGSSPDNVRRFVVVDSLPSDGRLMNRNVALGSDINLKGEVWENGLNFNGEGLLHGLGHEVHNLTIDHTQTINAQSSPKHVGFIQELSGGVRDLTLSNVDIKTTINNDGNGRKYYEPVGVGTLIGKAGDVTIKNVNVSGNMHDLGDYGNIEMARLIGIARGNVRVINSYGYVNADAQAQTPVGNIIGGSGRLSEDSGNDFSGRNDYRDPPQSVSPKPPVTTPTQPVTPKPPVTTPTQPVTPKPPVTTPTQPVTPKPPVTTPTQPVTPKPPVTTPTQPVTPKPPVTTPTQPVTPKPPVTTPTQPVTPKPPVHLSPVTGVPNNVLTPILNPFNPACWVNGTCNNKLPNINQLQPPVSMPVSSTPTETGGNKLSPIPNKDRKPVSGSLKTGKDKLPVNNTQAKPSDENTATQPNTEIPKVYSSPYAIEKYEDLSKLLFKEQFNTDRMVWNPKEKKWEKSGVIGELPYKYGSRYGLDPEFNPAQYTGLYHSGIDYRANIGTKVYSPIDGEIVRVDKENSAGLSGVYIRDDKTGRVFIVYHVKAAHKNITKGNRVSKGDLVAEVVNYPANGVHLHVELRGHAAAISPKHKHMKSKENLASKEANSFNPLDILD